MEHRFKVSRCCCVVDNTPHPICVRFLINTLPSNWTVTFDPGTPGVDFSTDTREVCDWVVALDPFLGIVESESAGGGVSRLRVRQAPFAFITAAETLIDGTETKRIMIADAITASSFGDPIGTEVGDIAPIPPYS